MAIINARSTYRNPLTVVNTEADDVYINALNKIGQVASCLLYTSDAADE